METRQVIQSSATVIRITNLKKGDVYKRIDDESFGEAKVRYGVVIDLLNDGSKCYIEAMEYQKDYGDNVKAELKVFSGKKDIAIFPATPDEIHQYLESALVSMKRSIEEKKEELQKKIEGWNRAKDFVSGEQAKQLTEAIFETTSQPEFDRIKELTATTI